MTFKNLYLKSIHNTLIKRNANEPEFIQAVEEMLNSLMLVLKHRPEIEKNNIIERLIEPERLIQFRVPWVDDNGKVQVNRAFRVEFNSSIGPYKGGLRLHPTVNASIIKFLGFEQIFKNALTGLPMGGGKGGADFNPKGKSNAEIMRFCQSLITELYRHISPNTDVPAGDIGVGEREIGYMFGQYKRITNTFTGILTGKGLQYGGSLFRKEATGYGLCYYTQEMLKTFCNSTFKNKIVIISGCGNVAIHAAQKAIDLGAKVVALSDSDGYIYDKNGIQIDIIKTIKEVERGRISEYAKRVKNVEYSNRSENIWNIPCDIALPCATQNELNKKSAEKLVQNGVICVAEGANMPCTQDAVKTWLTNNIPFGPGKAANAGGVACSGLEMSQNSMRYSWSFDEIDTKIHNIMKNIFAEGYTASKEYGAKGNMVVGSNISGFNKICDAMLAQGVV